MQNLSSSRCVVVVFIMLEVSPSYNSDWYLPVFGPLRIRRITEIDSLERAVTVKSTEDHLHPMIANELELKSCSAIYVRLYGSVMVLDTKSRPQRGVFSVSR